MCLLIAGKSNEIRNTLLNTAGLLTDIFASNADGVGAMYTTSKRKLRTPKVVPKNFAQCAAFIRQLPDDDRSLAIHFRMRTHGHTDLTNCHPYPVIEGQIAMMHNGILSHGNKADTTKSDTWHYITNTIRPMLEMAPKMFTNQAWLNLVEEDITNSNRFAIMDSDGDLVILNKDTGIEHEGLWFSNTYAWTPELLIPGYRKAFKASAWMDRFDDEEDYGLGATWRGNTLPTSYSNPNVHAKALADSAGVEANGDFVLGEDENFTSDDVWESLSASEPEQLSDYLQWRPNFTLRTIMDECEFYLDSGRELTRNDAIIVKLLIDGNTTELARLCISSAWQADGIAEIMCWYGTWAGKAINANEADIIAAEEQDALNQELLALTAGATATSADYAG